MIHLNSIILYFVVSILIAITAFVYSYVLVQPGEIFAKIFLKLDLFFKSDERRAQGLGVHWLFKMIMWCEKCVAGQLALWIYLICCWPWYLQGYFIMIIPHFLFVGLTIFLTLVIKKIYLKHIA